MHFCKMLLIAILSHRLGPATREIGRCPVVVDKSGILP